MTIVLLILKIIGIILLSIIALFIFAILLLLVLSLFKTKVILSYDENFSVFIKHLFVKIRLFPKKKKDKKSKKGNDIKKGNIPQAEEFSGGEKRIQKEEKTARTDPEIKPLNNEEENKEGEKKKEEEENENEDSYFKIILKSLDFSDYIKIITLLIKRLLRFIKIEKLELNAKIAEDDAAQTAVKYGEINALIYPLIGILHSNDKLKEARINLTPDFTAIRSEYFGTLEISTRLIHFYKTLFLIAKYIFKKRKSANSK